MFSENQIYGNTLPDKTLCFTFDDGPGETEGDGPGPKTSRLAQYLYEQRIGATFFAVGKFISQYPLIISEISSFGHIVGNHTFTHPYMVPFFDKGGDIVAEIHSTNNLIEGIIPNKNVFFRAPYGQWDAKLSRYLNERLDNTFNHIGPFNWDINSNDFAYWGQGKSAEECAAAYLSTITQIRKGIILMHDCTADNDTMKKNNRTYETVKILVPKLRDMGYSFVRLDEIPLYG